MVNHVANKGSARRSASAAHGKDESGNLEFRIDRDGQWFYHGSPIRRKELVRYYASLLHRDAAGNHWLISPFQKVRIEVEDVAFLAVELTVEGADDSQRLIFRTNVDEIVIVDSAHPLRIEHDSQSGEPAPYVTVRNGLEARMTRSVFYELAELAMDKQKDGEHILGVWSSGTYFPIGPAAD
jgi:hypothetical protein